MANANRDEVIDTINSLAQARAEQARIELAAEWRKAASAAQVRGDKRTVAFCEEQIQSLLGV